MYKPITEHRKDYGKLYYLFNVLPYVLFFGTIAVLVLAGFGLLHLIK